MNDPFGMIGSVWAGGGFNLDDDEDIYPTQDWRRTYDFNQDDSTVQVEYTLVGVE
jgi:hypothetical protein